VLSESSMVVKSLVRAGKVKVAAAYRDIANDSVMLLN
jgi:hypothetical protein